jgi:hypothetical protein
MVGAISSTATTAWHDQSEECAKCAQIAGVQRANAGEMYDT